MTTLSEQAYRTIKADIIRGVLRPDQQITQAAIVEQYDLSLAAVRDALQQLANEGFVRSIPRYGYLISPITISDVYEIYELRIPVEVTAARLATERATEAALARIAEDASYTYVYKDIDSYSRFLKYNTHFHRAIAEATGNDRLVRVLSQLLDESDQIFHLALDLKDGAQETLTEHMELARALKERDPDRAEYLVREQVERSLEVVLAAVTRRGTVASSSQLGRAITT